MSKQKKIGFVLFLVLAFGVLLVLNSHEVTGAAKQTVTVAKVKKAPAGLDDPVWSKDQAVQLLVEGREKSVGANGTVTSRALYTDDSLYFLSRWKDPTQSVVKQSWKFDGQRWYHLKGNEDRIALLFEITRINKFATRGCAVICHSPADLPREQWKFATKTAAEKGDLWHWKAARSAPYNYADDVEF